MRPGQARRPGGPASVRLASLVSGRPRPDAGGRGGEGITGSSFPLRCANQNKTKQNHPQKNTVVLSPHQMKTPPTPKHSPQLVPTLQTPQKKGAQARRPVALAQCVAVAVAVARAGSHPGPRHQQPLALHGSGQSARRAGCSPPRGRSGSKGSRWRPRLGAAAGDSLSASRGQT